MQFAFDPSAVEAKIAELQDLAGPFPRIHYGCDFHLTPENIEDALRSPGKYSIDHRGYLLVEFSESFIPKTISEIFARMLDRGIHPVLTHPERNALLRNRLPDLEAWAEMGCLLQVTAQSLLGLFGKRARDFSHTLMSRRLVHFLASDAHDLKHRTTQLQPVWDYVEEHFGGDTARLLLEDNPRAALSGHSLAAQSMPQPRKKWLFFKRKNLAHKLAC
jgi:protein-tyrosine phosphatase